MYLFELSHLIYMHINFHIFQKLYCSVNYKKKIKIGTYSLSNKYKVKYFTCNLY